MNENSQDSKELSKRDVIKWGGAGGLLFALGDLGLLNFRGVEKIFEASNSLPTQLSTLVVFGLIIVAVGAIWARIHAPIRTIAIAFQLGLVAPIAVTAAVENAVAEIALSDESSSIILPSLVISTAHASDQTNVQPMSQPKPTIWDCIIKTLIKKPC